MGCSFPCNDDNDDKYVLFSKIITQSHDFYDVAMIDSCWQWMVLTKDRNLFLIP